MALSQRDHPAELAVLAVPSAGESLDAQTSIAGTNAPGELVRDAVEATPEQLALGGELYGRHCAVCHGPGGQGGV
ncbi:MAG: hypothetical protein GWO02_14400, partial [Gammaproteobacteria bacterium]|nr:hypothetical protein [Gammaproteobacteria bacterium]